LNTVLEECKRLRGEVETLTPQAQHFSAIQEWGRQQNISAQEFQTGLALMALTKSNPVEALKFFQPIVEQLKREAGVVEALPDDLAQQVADGEVSEAMAKEIATMRLQNENARRREQARNQADQASEQRRTHETQTRELLKVLSGWDGEQVSKDPDFGKKRSLVKAHLDSIWARDGFPNTREEMMADAAKALEAANKVLKEIIPPLKSITPTPDGNRTTQVPAQPKSPREAGLQAYRAMRR
jgi:hypothetical protein